MFPILRADRSERRARLRMVVVLALAAALVSQAPIPSAVRAEDLARLRGTFEVDFADDCWFPALKAAGQIALRVERSGSDLIVHGGFSGTEEIHRRITCPHAGITFDLDATVEYNFGFEAPVDPATGAFTAGVEPDVAALGTSIRGTVANCRDPGNPGSSFCNRPDREISDILYGIVVKGTVSESGAASGEILDADPKTDLSGTWAASGPPFTFGPGASEQPVCTPPPGTGIGPHSSAIAGRNLVAAVGPALAVDACAGLDLVIDHIEVVQVVQDAQNSIPLVTGKTAVARVFVRRKGGQDALVTVSAVLNGFVGGQLQPETLRPFGDTVFVTDTVARENINASVNFRLPPNWISSGELQLDAIVDLADGAEDPVPSDNMGSVTVIVDDRDRLDVAWQPICLGEDPATHRPTQCPSDQLLAQVPGWVNIVQQVFPIREGGLRIFRLPDPPWVYLKPVNSDAGIAALNVFIRSQYQLASALSWQSMQRTPDQLFGIITDGAGAPAGGAADTLGFGGRSDPSVAHTFWLVDSGSGWGLAHEIGHNLGLHHVADPECPESGAPFDRLRLGDAAIGEIGLQVKPVVVVGASTKDFMSYCGDPRWIAPEHYRALYRGNFSPPRDEPTGQAAGGARLLEAAAQLATAEYLLVSGTVRRDGTQGALDIPLRITSSAALEGVLSATAGTWCLVLAGPAGPLRERCFDPSFTAPETGAELPETAFSFMFPAEIGADRLTLLVGGRVLASIKAGSAPPTITVDRHAGETWTTPRDIPYSAADADGDRLRVTVVYSADGGSRWWPYVPDATSGSVPVEPSLLQTGPQNLFRILVSDGLHTTVVDVGPINVPASVGRTDLAGGPLDPTAPQPPGAPSPALPLLLGLAGLAVVGLAVGRVPLAAAAASSRSEPRSEPLPAATGGAMGRTASTASAASCSTMVNSAPAAATASRPSVMAWQVRRQQARRRNEPARGTTWVRCPMYPCPP